jgi:PDZ domain-containing secreted protein
MSIKQFNGEWVCQQDRVLFRFNTSEDQEFSFWLTRYVLKGLIQGAQQVAAQALEQAHSPHVAQVMQSFQQATVTQQLNFEETFQEAKEKPMGDAPLLVTGLSLNQEGDVVTIKFDLEADRAVQVQMNPAVLQVMLALLDKLQALAQWGVGLVPTDLQELAVSTRNASTLMH